MPKASLALTLVALLPVPLAAGPPEGPSARMVFDEVADGLRQFRAEQDETKRVEWIGKLARTRDPRVAIALAGARTTFDVVGAQAHMMLAIYFVPPGMKSSEDIVDAWWKENEADLRRRASQLPR